jgi:hypothetical protein
MAEVLAQQLDQLQASQLRLCLAAYQGLKSTEAQMMLEALKEELGQQQK